MIKFISGSKSGGSKLFGIGLTDRNMELLKEGRPISFSMKEILYEDCKVLTEEDEVFIFHGKDEQTILDELKNRSWDMSGTKFRDFRNGRSA